MLEQLGSQIQVFSTLNINSCVVPVLLNLCDINCLFFQALEEQISQEDSTSQALREEVLAKEQNMSELHTAMKEVRHRPTPKNVSCCSV